jgi:hypothetical protein
LVQAAAALKQIDGSCKATASASETFKTTASGADLTRAIAVSANDLVSGPTTALATVTVTWGSTHWELSTGVLFSTLA